MKTRSLCLLLAALFAAVMPLTAEEPKPASPLEPIAWVVGDWHATANPPDGKPVEIDNHIYWSETKTAIFFVTRFNGEPHYSGMYAWDPVAGKIGFWYVDTEGNFTQGTTKVEGGKMAQEFTIAHPNGKADPLVSVIEPAADGNSYHWQVMRPGETQPLIQLTYTRKKQ